MTKYEYDFWLGLVKWHFQTEGIDFNHPYDYEFDRGKYENNGAKRSHHKY